MEKAPGEKESSRKHESTKARKKRGNCSGSQFRGSRFKVKLMKERLYECGIHPVLATEFRRNSMLPCKCEESKASNREP